MTTKPDVTRGRDSIDRAGNDAAAIAGLEEEDVADAGAGASRGVPGIDPATGEVSGAGSGTGGGNPGEDYDDDHTTGSNQR